MADFTVHPKLEAESVFVRDLPLCQLRFSNQNLLPWLMLLPRKANLTEIYKLSRDERIQLMDEVQMTSLAVVKLFSPDKINIEALGNVVPQVHVHVIGRYHKDPAWPVAIWGKLPASPYAPDELEKTIERINDDALWR